jgi:hypothetical protein
MTHSRSLSLRRQRMPRAGRPGNARQAPSPVLVRVRRPNTACGAERGEPCSTTAISRPVTGTHDRVARGAVAFRDRRDDGCPPIDSRTDDGAPPIDLRPGTHAPQPLWLRGAGTAARGGAGRRRRDGTAACGRRGQVSVKRRTELSTPQVKSQGWVGWKTRSMTPSDPSHLCAWSRLSGTMRGFCIRSA